MAILEKVVPVHMTDEEGAGTDRWRVVLITLVVLVIALVPRVWSLDAVVTTDEARFWAWRSEWFLRAVQEGRYADTNIIGHPGVTTMWLGAAGFVLHQAVTGAEGTGPVNPYQLLSSPLQRVLMRLPVALVTALSVALAYPLLCRLLDRRVALLAVLFWATDPFLVAHSRVLHLDALLTSFVMLALLALAGCRTEGEGRRTENRARPQSPSPSRQSLVPWSLVGSAVAGGLAFLTKSPAVILLPMVGLIALVGIIETEQRTLGTPPFNLKPQTSVRGWLRVLGSWFLVLCTWCGIAGLVWLALWPAVWVDPVAAVLRVVGQAGDDGGAVHSWGNFFLGRVVDDPGPLFYPVAVAFRLTPWALVGLVAALVALGRRWRGQRTADGRRQTADRGGWFVAVLVVFIALFLLMMSIPPKKFDRYALPIFPALHILAAVGWIALLDWGRRGWRQRGREPDRAARLGRLRSVGAWALLAVGLGANLAWYHPYELAYYNPLLGGGPAATRAVYVGWGEGLEQAGAYISGQFNGCDRTIVSWYDEVLRQFVCTQVERIDRVTTFDHAGYVVMYVNQLQRGIETEKLTRLAEQGTLLHTVRIHGIPYAQIYQVAPPVTTTLEADFGPALRLRGYDLDTSAVRATGTLSLTVQWQALAAMERDYNIFIHLLDAQGQMVAQVDVPPGGPHAPTSIWQPGQFVDWTQRVPLPADLPPGTYWISLGVYDPADFARLPLRGPTQPGAPGDGEHALVVTACTLP